MNRRTLLLGVAGGGILTALGGLTALVGAAGLTQEDPADSGSDDVGISVPPGVNGWTWPSEVRGVTQGYHDGFSLDLAVGPAGALFAPYDGVVYVAGEDVNIIPGACQANPSWWRGVNQRIIIQHNVNGLTLYSSHNHVDPGGFARLGIAAGMSVKSGQQVAVAGMSGCTSGPHTHFTLSSMPINHWGDVEPYAFLGHP